MEEVYCCVKIKVLWERKCVLGERVGVFWERGNAVGKWNCCGRVG